MTRTTSLLVTLALWGCSGMEANRSEAERYYRMGLNYSEQGSSFQAAESFKFAIQQDPTFAEAHMELGAEYVRGGTRLADAIEEFKEALAQNPKLWKAKHYWVVTLRLQNDLDGAIRLQRELVSEVPERAEELNNLARLYLDKKNFPEAIAWYRKALEVRPNYPLARGGLGVALWHGGEVAEGIAALQEAVKGLPERLDLRVELARAHLAAGSFDQARAIADELRVLEPEAGMVYHLYAEIYAAQGQLPKAAEFGRLATLKGVMLDPALSRKLSDVKREKTEGVPP
jgi:tetratricopeptide (TPR) repeat protein